MVGKGSRSGFAGRAVAVILGTMAALIMAGTIGTDGLSAQDSGLGGRWSIALELGEIPKAGSFKAGISVGYHVSDEAWIGFAYQLPDSIRRGRHSFNAQGTGLEGLTGTREGVGRRAYLQARLRPTRWSPYLSLGVVFNDRDTETMVFDSRSREVDGATFSGPMEVTVSRPPGVRPALGLGYEYTSGGGFTAFVEWAGWWLRGAPTPEIRFLGSPPKSRFASGLTTRIEDDFTGSPFNTYHLFQLGIGYTR